MELSKLIVTLSDLKKNRKLSSEAEAIIAPFLGSSYSVQLSFVSESRTFSSRHKDGFEGGKTVVANFLDGGLECAILFPKEENEWVEGLNEEDEFECRVEVLELDNLYQRIIFGQSLGESDEKKLNLSNEVILVKPQKTELSQLKTEKELDLIIEEKEIGKVVHEPDISEVELVSEQESESFDLNVPIVELEEENEIEKQEFAIGDTPVIVVESRESTEKNSEDDLGMDSTTNLIVEDAEEEKPPPFPLQEEARNEVLTDSLDLEKILDKRYNFGSDSLSYEEREILQNSKKLPKDEIENDKSKGKAHETVKSDADGLALGCRTLIAIPFAYLGFTALDEGFIVMCFGFIFLSVAYKLVKPLIQHIQHNGKNKM